MAKPKKSSKGDSSVTIKKPVEAEAPEVTETPAIETPKVDIAETIKESVKNALAEKEVPKKTRKKSVRKQPTKHGLEESESQIIQDSEKVTKGHSNGFYVGIAIGIIGGSIGLVLLYNALKNKFAKSPEDKILDQIEKEKVIKLENIRKENEIKEKLR